MTDTTEQTLAGQTPPSDQQNTDTALPEGATSTDTEGQGAQPEPKPQKDPNRALLRRVAEESERRRKAEKELAELRAASGTAATSQPDIDLLVEQRLQIREQQKIAKEIFDAGTKAFPDYETSVRNLSAALGDRVHDRDFLDAVFALPNAASVIHKLGNDLEVADEVASLSPVKMAMKLAKISAALEAPAPKTQGTQPPPPIKPLGSTTTSSFKKDPEKMSIPEMDAWMRERRKERGR